MRKEYEEWENEFSERVKSEMMRKEGYPFVRSERIVVGGVISSVENFEQVVPISGTLVMMHSYGPDRVYGNFVSHWGESYVDGRLTEDEFDFIEFYIAPHSEMDTREYSLSKKGDVFEGRVKCSNKNRQLAEGFVKFDVVSSAGIYLPKQFEIIPPQCMHLDHSKIRDFWDRLSSEKEISNIRRL